MNAKWYLKILQELKYSKVENTTAAAASMALNVPAINRWCVSGTCIQRGLDDLYGLFLFLQKEPFSQRRWWYRVIQNPYLCGDKVAK